MKCNHIYFRQTRIRPPKATRTKAYWGQRRRSVIQRDTRAHKRLRRVSDLRSPIRP